MLVALAVTIPLFALPAQAAPAVGTAELTSGSTVLSGDTDNPFGIKVTNTGGVNGTVINEVQVLVPISGFTIKTVAAPANWNSSYNAATGRVFFFGNTIGNGNPVQGNPSATFTITADVIRQAADTSRNWSVLLSNDGGTSFSQATVAPGALTSAIKVLKAISVAITAPLGATDGSVTESQTVSVNEVIQNAGSAALTVTPTLSSNDIVGSPISGTAASIPSGSQATFTFSSVKFGTPPADGHKAVIGGGGTATGANAIGAASSPITIMSKAAFSYVVNSLQPTDVVPNHPYAFQLTVSKTGDVAGGIGTSTFKLGPAGEFSAAIDPTTNTINGGNASYPLKFVSTNVPTTLADGNYTPALTIAGTDENGAPISATPGVTNQVNLDRLAPVVTPSITPPKSKTAGESDAATNGKSNTLGGSITDGSGNPPCGACTITGAFVRELNASNGTVKDDPVTMTNTSGTMSGSFTATFDPATSSIQLYVTSADKAGNSTQGVSAAVPVDNIAPKISSALTGGGPGTSDVTRIDVFFTEHVTSPAPLQADWNVPGHTVTAVQPAAPQTQAGYDHVLLTVAPALGGDEKPNVQYAPSPATRASDRVGLSLADQAILAADGIVPDAPAILQVSGHSAQTDGFYTNDTTPDFQLGSVGDGQTVTVYRDSDNSHTVTPGDTVLGQAIATGSQVTVTSSNLGTINQVFGFVTVSKDAANNTGPASSGTLHMDFISPTVLTASAAGGTITVSFSEPLAAGRNGAADWFASGTTSGVSYNYGVGSVSGTGTSRAATIQDSNFDTATTALASVSYDFQGAAVDQYTDAAGNLLGNFTKAIT
jgi:hypothetical protein